MTITQLLVREHLQMKYLLFVVFQTDWWYGSHKATKLK